MTYIPTEPKDIDYPADADCPTCSLPSRLTLPQSQTSLTGTDGGITEHSTDERYFIIEPDKQGAKGKAEFEAWLTSNNIGFKPLIGKWQGKIAFSYIINARDWLRVRDSGYVTKQEYLLYLWPHAYGYTEFGVDARKATLYDLGGHLPDKTWTLDTANNGYYKDLGVLIAINNSDLDYFADWSYDINHDQYYAVREQKSDTHISHWNSKQWEQYETLTQEG